MSKELSFAQTLDFLKSCDNVNILTHKSPDGDTLGAGFALCSFLRKLGKKANVLNTDNFPLRYSMLYEGYYVMEFDEQCVIAVDIADVQLLGSHLSHYAEEGKIDLCIDHHISNTHYAKATLLDSKASAACLVLYQMFKFGGFELDDYIAKCLYLGISTDTGCFKYENTTPEAHIAASELMSYNFNFAQLNRKMFDLKSKGRVQVEQAVTSSMEYYFNDRVTVIVVTTELVNESKIDPAEFDGLASIPLQVEGVLAGITIKQRDTNRFKVSMRTADDVNASEICRRFGGGGHVRAAGCELHGTLEEVKKQILDAVGEVVNGIAL